MFKLKLLSFKPICLTFSPLYTERFKKNYTWHLWISLAPSLSHLLCVWKDAKSKHTSNAVHEFSALNVSSTFEWWKSVSLSAEVIIMWSGPCCASSVNSVLRAWQGRRSLDQVHLASAATQAQYIRQALERLEFLIEFIFSTLDLFLMWFISLQGGLSQAESLE